MSKKIKGLVEKELNKRLSTTEGVGVINPRGVDGIKNNGIRRRLRAQGLRMVVVKNTLARRATADSKIKGFESLLDGPSALIYGKTTVSAMARLMLDEQKKDEKLEIRGLFFDGELYSGKAGIEQASKLPTREEAIANILSAILGPGRKLAAALKGPGGTLGAVLKSIEEKAEKAGGTEAPVEAAPVA